ncbi:hypothetical protein HaLaN_26271, partial [Haematococcus lacustris]
MFFG